MINKALHFVNKEEKKFFLIFYELEATYNLKLEVYKYYRPAVKLIFDLEKVHISQTTDSSIKNEKTEASRYIIAKERETINLNDEKLAFLVQDEGEIPQGNPKIRNLMHGVFIGLLSLYFKENSFVEPLLLKKGEQKQNSDIHIVNLSLKIKEIKRKGVFWEIFLNNVINNYLSNIPLPLFVDLFQGDRVLARITLEKTPIVASLENRSMVVDMYVKPDFGKSPSHQKFATIEVFGEFPDKIKEEVSVSINILKDAVDNNFYLKKENIDVFIKDIAKLFMKFGIISKVEDFVFLAKMMKLLQVVPRLEKDV